MSTECVEVYAKLYKSAGKSVTETAEKVSEGKRLHQIAEGKSHPLWLVGHLTFTRDRIVNQWLLGGETKVPAEYRDMFAPDFMKGKAPTANAADYPSWTDVLDSYKKVCAHTDELLERLSDEDLAGGLKGEVSDKAREVFGLLGDALLSMGLHEAHHRGQIGLIDAL